MPKLLTPGITAYDSPYLTNTNTGLGNVMFQVASVWGFSKTTGRSFSSYRLKMYCDRLKERFGFDHGDTLYKNFLLNSDSTTAPTTFIDDKGGKRYDPHIIPAIVACNDDCIQINNHLECPLNFHKYRDELLQILECDRMKDALKSLVPKLFDPSITPISVHVRNAYDAVKFNNTYYVNAVAFFNTFIHNPFFFIFIDDPQQMPFDPAALGMKDYQYVHSHMDYIDLYLMSFCNHHISSISTFAWWGSYLCQNPNKIITVSRPAAEFMKQASHLSEKEILDDYYMSYGKILPG